MKQTLLFLGILIFSSSVFAREPSCVESVLIANTALEDHIQFKRISPDFLERVLPSYLRIKDPFKVNLLQSEVDALQSKIVSTKEEVLDNIRKNHCEFFTSVDQKVKEGNDRWIKISKEILALPEDQILKFEKIDRGEKPVPFKTEAELKTYAHYLVGKFVQASMEGKKKKNFKDVLKEYANSLKDTRKPQTQGAVLTKAMFLSFDPHSSYLTPSEGEEFKIAMSAQLVGVGVQLQNSDIGVKITNVIPNGPAAKEGTIKKGDIINKIDGKSALTYDTNDVAQKVRGEKGTKVTLTISREENGKTVFKTVKLTRDLISLDDTRAKGKMFDMGGKKVALINLPGFYQDASRGIGTATDILNEYNRLKKEGKIDAVVLDLRYNGGGYLDEAVKVVGLFVKEAVAVQVKTAKGEVRKLRSGPAPSYIEEPLVVAINKYSASASEIVAGALKDYGRAVIVGDERTFGKGTVQGVKNNFQSENMGLIKVTSAQFYTPDGSSTQIKGVESDIVIPSPSNFRDIGEKNEPFAIDWNSVESIFSKKHSSYFSKSLDGLKKKSKERISKDKDYEDFKNEESLEAMRKRQASEGDADAEVFKFDPKKDAVLREVLNITKDLAVDLAKP